MKVTISPDVISEIVDDQAVLLDLRGGAYYTLNRVGTRMWTLLGTHDRTEIVMQALEREFDVDPSELARDVGAWTRELAARGLVLLEEE